MRSVDGQGTRQDNPNGPMPVNRLEKKVGCCVFGQATTAMDENHGPWAWYKSQPQLALRGTVLAMVGSSQAVGASRTVYKRVKGTYTTLSKAPVFMYVFAQVCGVGESRYAEPRRLRGAYMVVYALACLPGSPAACTLYSVLTSGNGFFSSRPVFRLSYLVLRPF